MIEHLILLAGYLREAGVPVSTPEVTDAAAALSAMPSYERSRVRAVLSSCLIKDKTYAEVFENIFEQVYSPVRRAFDSGGQQADGSGRMHGSGGRGEEGDGSGGEGRGRGGGDKKEGDFSPEYIADQSGLLNLPFLAVNFDKKQEMLALVKNLAQRLARKKGSRYERGKEKADFRRLWRNSMASGGVPLELAWRKRRLNRPRVFIICDLSNSMYAYLPFFLEFVLSFAAVRSTVRVFGFVDVLEEVTAHIDPLSVEKSVEALSDKARVYRRGLTDYGNAFKGFYRHHREELTKRSFLVIVGDARNNYYNAGIDYLREFKARAAAIYWLNPEDRASWGTGDSYMDVYAPLCDGAFACENISQLRSFADSFDLK